jgi:tRNA-uridine 2-sulfurtransferase
MQTKGNSAKVIVGMSGGLDSSVAAALLKAQGYSVTGVIMKIWSGEAVSGSGKHGCYGPEEEDDIEDARKVADKLGIPFHVIDLTGEYQSEVLDYFCHEYSSGRTPNPCVRCNRRIKFGSLVEKARSLGIAFDYFATGHYAKVEYDKSVSRYLLKKGRDIKKDQSYFLFELTQEQLARTLFPLGDLLKDYVRKMSARLELGVENKPESQNFVCGNYTNLFDAKSEKGPIIDNQGHVLGEHDGIVRYTIGQRKGLRLAAAEPLYVTDILPEKNAVVVGQKQELYVVSQTVSDLNWISIESLTGPMKVKARIRNAHHGYEATISPAGQGVLVTYTEPQVGAAPGQAIVFYDGDVVVGGGIARRAQKQRIAQHIHAG